MSEKNQEHNKMHHLKKKVSGTKNSAERLPDGQESKEEEVDDEFWSTLEDVGPETALFW